MTKGQRLTRIGVLVVIDGLKIATAVAALKASAMLIAKII